MRCISDNLSPPTEKEKLFPQRHVQRSESVRSWMSRPMFPSRTMEWKRVFPLDDRASARRVRSRFRKSDAFVLSLSCPRVNSIYRRPLVLFAGFGTGTLREIGSRNGNIVLIDGPVTNSDECREINGRVMSFCWFMILSLCLKLLLNTLQYSIFNIQFSKN